MIRDIFAPISFELFLLFGGMCLFFLENFCEGGFKNLFKTFQKSRENHKIFFRKKNSSPMSTRSLTLTSTTLTKSTPISTSYVESPRIRSANYQGSIAWLSVFLSLISLLFKRSLTLRQTSYSDFLVQDGFVYVSQTILLMSALVFISLSQRKEDSRFFSRFLFFLAGSLFLLMANDFLLFLISFEIVSLLLTLMLVSDSLDVRTAREVFLIFCLGTGLITLGLTLLFLFHGSLLFDSFLWNKPFWGKQEKSLTVLFPCSLILLGTSLKILFVPCHGIFKKVSEKASWPCFFVLNLFLVFVGAMTLIRFVNMVPDMKFILGGLGFFGMCVGFLGLLIQKSLKGFLSCLSFGNLGFILFGFSTTGLNILTDCFFFFVLQAAGLLLFYGVISSCQEFAFSDLKGLRRQSMLITFSLGMSLFCLAGFPVAPSIISIFLMIKNVALEGMSFVLVCMIGFRIISWYGIFRIVLSLLSLDDSRQSEGKTETIGFLTLLKILPFWIFFLSVWNSPYILLNWLSRAEIALRYYSTI